MTRIDRRTFLAAAGATAAVPFAACAQESPGGWSAKASLPWPVQEIYCAVSGGRIVTAGGLVGRPGGVLHIEDRTGVYDVAADAWSEGPKLPAPRHHPMLIAGDDGRVLVLGGYGRSDSGDWTAMTDVWALEADRWAPVGQMPQRLCETVGVSVGERMHLVTGRSPAGEANGEWNDQADVATHLVYAPGEDRWETARPCPMARNSAAGAVLDGAIWVAGGRTVSGGWGQAGRVRRRVVRPGRRRGVRRDVDLRSGGGPLGGGAGDADAAPWAGGGGRGRRGLRHRRRRGGLRRPRRRRRGGVRPLRLLCQLKTEMVVMTDHESYIAAAPEHLRPMLTGLRAKLVEALPDAEPVMEYGMPGFRIGKSIVAGYAAFSQQCGLYLPAGAIASHADEIAAAGLKSTKTGVTFSPRKPIPDELVTRLALTSRRTVGL